MSRFDSQCYQIFWEVVGLERGPISLVSVIEGLLERKSSGSGLENLKYTNRDPSRWPRDTHYPQKLALTSPTCGGRSVGVVRSRTQATKFMLNVSTVEIKRHGIKQVSNWIVSYASPATRHVGETALRNSDAKTPGWSVDLHAGSE
jgi:hypothetical protein